MVDVCSSEFFHAQMMCEARTQIRDMITRAESVLATATAELDAVQATAESYMDDLSDVTYNPQVSGLDYTHTVPTYNPETPPAGYTVPDATTALIASADFDDIYTRGSDRASREAERLDWQADDRMNELGIGLPSVATLARLDEASHKRKELLQNVTLEQAVSEATMLREDVKVLHQLHIDSYNAASQRWTVQLGIYEAYLKLDAQKLGWTELEQKEKLEVADKQAQYALLIAKNVNDVLLTAQQRISELWIGLAQSLFANANVSVSGSGSASVSTSITE